MKKCSNGHSMRPSSAPALSKRKNHSDISREVHQKENVITQKSQKKLINLGNLQYFLDDQNFHRNLKKKEEEKSENDESIDDYSSKLSSKFSSRPDFDLTFQSSTNGHRLSRVNNMSGTNKPRKETTFVTQKKALMKKIKHFSKPKNDEELRSSKVWTSLRIKDIYPAGQEIRYMDEKPIEFKPDPPPPQTQTQSSNSLLERMRTLSQEYIPHDHDDNDSLEEDAQRNIEGKFLFRSRFHHVLETLQRETLPVSPITKKISPSQTQYGTSNHSQFLDNYSHRKSYSVFNEIQVDNPKDTIQSNTNSLSDSVELSRSTFTEDPNHKIALSSPRAAMIMEGHVRYQIPYVIKELVGNVNVEQTSIINLTGQGIGDEKMLCLVQALPYFKNVDEINISNNRLTDKSIRPFLKTVLGNLPCAILDISANKVDSESIEMLKDYLERSDCHLRELRFCKSDIDDTECTEIMNSLIINRTLTSLNLSDNQIGVKEDLNAARPSFITGPEGIAEMLLQNRTLTALDISWNSIRGESAIVLGQSLATNNTLKILNLAYNNLGDEGAQQLAHSLRFNLILEDVDISYNNISPKTALVFAQVFSQNINVVRFNVSGNCLGKIGSRELLRAIRMAASDKRILRIDMDGCNMTYLDDTFDRNNASGEYQLDLSNTYGYAVACILYELANTKPDAHFIKVQHGIKNSSYDPFQKNNAKKSQRAEFHWKDVQLKRGPSQAEISRQMWTNVMNDILTTMTTLQPIKTPQKKQKSSHSSSFIKKKEDHYDIGEEWNQFYQQREKEKSRIRLALTKILTNFEMFPQEIVLNELVEHFFHLSNNQKNEIHLILKEIFLKVFELAWTESTNHLGGISNPYPSSGDGAILIRRSSSFTDDDNMINIEDVSKIIIALGWKNLNVENSFEMAKKIVKTFDLYDHQTISRADFVRYMFLNFTDTFASPPGPLIDDRTGCPWEVPTFGELLLTFQSTAMPPSADAVATDDTIKILTTTATKHVSKNEKQQQQSPSPPPHEQKQQRESITIDRNILKTSIIDEDFYITCEQAEVLLGQFQQDNLTPIIHSVELLLPQLASPKDACRFLATNLSFDQIALIRDKLQNFFRAVTGISGGHYVLDLTKKYDRLAAKKLVEQCNLEKSKRSSWKVPYLNTSQNGFNEAFRNASFNHRPLELTAGWFENLPETGKLVFDYVNVDRPVPGIEPVSNHFFHTILRETLFASHTDPQKEDEFELPADSKRKYSGTGRKMQFRNENSKFVAAKRYSTTLNKNILIEHVAKQVWTSFIDTTWSLFVERHTNHLLDTLRQAKKNAAAKRGFKESSTPPTLDTPNEEKLIANSTKEGKEKRKSTKKAVDLTLSVNESKIVNNAALYSLAYREARNVPVYLSEGTSFGLGVQSEEPSPAEHHNARRHSLTRSTETLQQATRLETHVKKCMQFEPIYRTLEVLLVYQLYFSVAQVEELLKALLERHVPLTVIVRCLQLLFSRVVDIENFNILLNKMNLSDREEIYHRIGILNIWNPLYPDIDYKLYLSSWDHREAAKILFRLAALEPGENLREQYYYHSVVEDAFPGWELPLSWTLEGAGSEIQALISAGKKIQEHHDEEGKLPKFGVVTFTYTSDPAAGCQADVNERDQLARTRTLTYYQGKFIDSISANNRRRSQTIPQSAVQFVGEKLRRLTLKGQDSLGLSSISNTRRRLSRMSSGGSHDTLSRNTSFDSASDQQVLSRQVSYHRVNSATPLAAIHED